MTKMKMYKTLGGTAKRVFELGGGFTGCDRVAATESARWMADNHPHVVGCFGYLNIWILILFRASDFEFRI